MELSGFKEKSLAHSANLKEGEGAAPFPAAMERQLPTPTSVPQAQRRSSKKTVGYFF